jgi:hypothetical protein
VISLFDVKTKASIFDVYNDIQWLCCDLKELSFQMKRKKQSELFHEKYQNQLNQVVNQLSDKSYFNDKLSFIDNLLIK